jgi:hypothetical protein
MRWTSTRSSTVTGVGGHKVTSIGRADVAVTAKTTDGTTKLALRSALVVPQSSYRLLSAISSSVFDDPVDLHTFRKSSPTNPGATAIPLNSLGVHLAGGAAACRSTWQYDKVLPEGNSSSTGVVMWAWSTDSQP